MFLTTFFKTYVSRFHQSIPKCSYVFNSLAFVGHGQTVQIQIRHAVSGQDLHYLLTECSIKVLKK